MFERAALQGVARISSRALVGTLVIAATALAGCLDTASAMSSARHVRDHSSIDRALDGVLPSTSPSVRLGPMAAAMRYRQRPPSGQRNTTPDARHSGTILEHGNPEA